MSMHTKYTIKEYATLVQQGLKDISENCCEETPILDIITTGSPECMRYAMSKRRLAKQLSVGCNILNVDETLYGDSYHLEDDFSFESPSIIQLPFFTNPSDPKKDQELINKCIDPSVDVDGLTKNSKFVPATALGIYHYLCNTTTDTNPVIVLIGRGKLVNAPLKKLIEENWPKATVVTTHTGTCTEQKLHLIQQANIIVSAIPTQDTYIWNEYMRRCEEDQDFLDEAYENNQIIIDAGFIIDPETNKVSGNIPENVKEYLNTTFGCYISPTIGGVGLLTTTFLLGNVIKYYYDKIATEDNLPFEAVYNVIQAQ